MTDTPQTGTVAWLLNGTEGYGVASVMFALSSKLQQRGWRTPLICMTAGRLTEQATKRGYDVTILDVGAAPDITGNPLRRLLGVLRTTAYQKKARHALRKAMQTIQPDVLEMQKSNLLGVGGAVARETGAVAVWDTGRALSTNAPLGLNRWYYQRICATYDITIIATSAYLASTVGDSHVKPIVVHNGVDAQRFDPNSVNHVSRAELGVPDNAIVFGIMARLTPWKGQRLFLEAMLRMGAHDPPLHLLLLGGPLDCEFAQQLRDVAESAGAADRLHMLGRVEQPERYYQAMDVVVNSRIDGEGFGLTVVEAMLLLRPVLAHSLGGPRETIDDGVTGWLLHEPTVEAYQDGIERAIGDRQRWQQMGIAGRQRALANYTTDCQADNFLKVVTPLVQQHRNAAAATSSPPVARR